MPRKSPFPPVPIGEALVIARTIWEQNGGQPMRRVYVLDALDRQPESSTSRQLITASSGYGLTKGSYSSVMLELTESGRAIVERGDTEEKLNAVLRADVFRSFFEKYQDVIVPSLPAALDFLRGQGISEKSAANCFEIILTNGREVGLIREISGKERVVSTGLDLEESVKSCGATSDEPAALQAPLQGTVVPQPGQGHPFPPEHSALTNQLPTLHIDIQIHISADAKPEQIDQVFASMARHLYDRGE